MIWDKESDPVVRDSIRRTVEDLDDDSTNRPAWKKGTNFLTPEIDTQQFEGDMMFGNTSMTVRVPAIWADAE